MQRTFSISTLGCKVNQQESAAIAEQFEKYGFRAAERGEPADVYVINSCTVTAIADSKTRQRIRQARIGSPAALVCVTGCMVETGRDAVASMDEIDIVIGNREKEHTAKIIVEFLTKRDGSLIEPGSLPETNISKPDNVRTRAFIKAEDGCDRFCAYCIIPYARGEVLSKPSETVLNEARAFLKAGYKEIVLTGINLALYGTDLIEKSADPGRRDNSFDMADKETSRQKTSSCIDLYELTKRLCELESDHEYRIRLGSLEPTVIDAHMASKIAALPGVCPHLHLSLQSGSRRTLNAMGRAYSPKDYRNIIKALKQIDPFFAVTTDVIVGFPGETEEDFEESLAFVREIGFAKVHVFKYSRRRGTRAAAMDGQVPDDVKNVRSRRMIEAVEREAEEFVRANCGKTRRTLIFGADGGGRFLRGITDNGIDLRVPTVAGTAYMQNEFCDLTLRKDYKFSV